MLNFSRLQGDFDPPVRLNNAASEHRLCRPMRGQREGVSPVKVLKEGIPLRSCGRISGMSLSAHDTRVSAQQLTLSSPRLPHGPLEW